MSAAPAPRPATPADAAELTRLRGHMLAAMGIDVDARPVWREECRRRFAELVTEPSFKAYVVDAPGGGLAACGGGWIDRRLPSPSSAGLVGHIANMCTDPAHRRQGHARAVLAALMRWFADEGVGRVELHATDEGRGLYEQVGFTAPDWPALRWTALPAR
jgi:GNAT superfamily N-acetyltransferase